MFSIQLAYVAVREIIDKTTSDITLLFSVDSSHGMHWIVVEEGSGKIEKASFFHMFEINLYFQLLVANVQFTHHKDCIHQLESLVENRKMYVFKQKCTSHLCWSYIQLLNSTESNKSTSSV
jgi:hypothetical protein